MPFLVFLSSLSWLRHPSDHPDGHPVFGFTKVYVPLGHITESVRKNFIPELSVRTPETKYIQGIFKCKNVQVPASAKAMKQSRKQAPNFVIVNLKNQIQI